jgi:hypothetical protein
MRLGALLLVIALLALLGGFSLAQLSTRATADAILVRALPELTDLDHDLTAHFDELQSEAATPGAAAGITLPSYPVKVSLHPGEVLNRTRAQVRGAVLTHAADVLYDRGVGALAPTNNRPGALSHFSIFSAPRLLQMELNVLSPRFHHRMQQLTTLALGAVVLLALAQFFLSREYNRAVMYGVALLIAAVLPLALALFAWLGVQLVAGTSADPFVGGVSDIARDCAWYVSMTCAVYAGVAIGLIVLGLVIERVSDALVPPAE